MLLRKAEFGDEAAAHRILPLVYGELRRLAAAKLSHESPGQTLQPTALVHDAWLRLGGDKQPHWENRAHFFGAAASSPNSALRSSTVRSFGEGSPDGDRLIIRIDRARRREALLLLPREPGGWRGGSARGSCDPGSDSRQNSR